MEGSVAFTLRLKRLAPAFTYKVRKGYYARATLARN